jgi:23S rRNA (guanosine2251-2'-O)-methyltransferase
MANRTNRNRHVAAGPRRHEARDLQLLWGLHTVAEALANPARIVRRLRATENAWRRLQDDRLVGRITPDIVRPQDINRILPEGAVHQGVLLEAEPLEPLDITEVPASGVALVLDQITDPHNVGAILRSAAAFQVTALIMTNRHSPEATGVLAKAASGALEHVPFCLVQNLHRALVDLGGRGFLRVGLDSEAPTQLEEAPLRTPLALVLGAEGKGLRQLTRETCDTVSRLDLPGDLASLNVSNAAALALYVARSRLAAVSSPS